MPNSTLAAVMRDMTITKVSYCAQGANPDADIVLFKSVNKADGSLKDLRERLEAALADAWSSSNDDYIWVRDYGSDWVVFDINSQCYRQSYTDDGITTSLVDGREQVTQDTEWVSTSKSVSTRKGAEMPETNEPTEQEIADLQKAIDDAVAEATAAAITKFTTELESVVEIEKAQADLDDGSDDPASIAKALGIPEAAAAEVAKARQEAVANKDRLDAIEKAETDRVVKSRAEALSHLGSVEDVSKILNAVIGDENYETIEKVLDAADTAIKESKLLTSIGDGGEPVHKNDEGGFVAKATTDGKFDLEAARELAKSDPEAYEAYRAQFANA